MRKQVIVQLWEVIVSLRGASAVARRSRSKPAAPRNWISSLRSEQATQSRLCRDRTLFCPYSFARNDTFVGILPNAELLRKQGFTLSELMLAFAILAFVLAGSLSLFISCIFLNESSRNLSLAIGHAQFILEDIKNTNFNSIKTGAIDQNTTWDWSALTITAQGLNALSNESINTQGSWLDAATKDRLNLTVTVSWKDRGIRDRNTSLATLLTEP